MKLKTKLITTIISSCLVLCLGVIGIFAVKTLNMSVGGNISFTADGITATISQGYLYNSAGTKYADSDVFVTGGTSEDMQPITITNDKKESEYTSLIATWANLDLKFNPAGDDIVLKFTITNTMSAKTLPVEVTANEGVDKNNNITLTVAPTTTDPIAASGSREYSITFHISDKSVNASLTGFNIEFVLGANPIVFEMVQTDTTYGEATFEVNKQTKTVTLSTTLKTNSAFLGWAKDSEENIVASELTVSVKYETATYYPVYESINDINLTFETNGNTAAIMVKSLSSTAPIVIPGVINKNGTSYLVTEIQNTAFGVPGDEEGSKTTSITLPDTITTIGNQAFYKCENITEIYIPASVTSIGTNVFPKSGVTKVVVDENNEVYDSRNNCNAIIETSTDTLIAGCGGTIIPNDIKKIAADSFGFCINLTSIEIPASVTEIGGSAFVYNTELKSVIVKSSTPATLGICAFLIPNGGPTIYVPDGSLSAYQSATNWKDYTLKNFSEFAG